MNAEGLWLGVIERALRDALGEVVISHSPKCGRGGTCAACRSREEARAWLAGGLPGFTAVAELAGIEPDRARARCLEIIQGARSLPRQSRAA